MSNRRRRWNEILLDEILGGRDLVLEEASAAASDERREAHVNVSRIQREKDEMGIIA